MSRPPQLEPAWLIGLLLAWSRRTGAIKGLGYPSRCIYLDERIGQSVQSYEPTGYGGQEIEQVGALIEKLRPMRCYAVLRFCRPWMIGAIDRELEHTYDTDTWLYHLKLALAELAEKMGPEPRIFANSSVTISDIG